MAPSGNPFLSFSRCRRGGRHRAEGRSHERRPILKVYYRGAFTERSYPDICHELGFLAETHFVQVNSAGSIGFTCGKPSEIRALAAAVSEHGYRPSKTLRNMTRI